MPQRTWEPWEPKDWGEQQAQRVAVEVRRLRGKRSAQWLSDRTHEFGYRVSRQVIADLENGRRRYVTTAELMILAVALNTTPIALIYPGPDYRKEISALPKLDMPEIWAAQWFSGMVRSTSDVPFGDDGGYVQVPHPEEYYDNQRRLERARQMFELDERQKALRRDLKRKRHYQSTGELQVTDAEISQIVDEIADIQWRIDELAELGGDPFYGNDELAGVRRHLMEFGQFPRDTDGGNQDGR